MSLDRADLSKLVFGSLLIGVGGFAASSTIGTVLATTASGAGVNWLSEAIGGAIGAGPPEESLRKALLSAVREAIGELRDEYGEERLAREPSNAFQLLRESARNVTGVTLPSDATDIVAVQRTLSGALDQLLHGHSENQVQLIRRKLLPTTTIMFQRELARNADAWRLYHGWLLQRLIDQNTHLHQILAAQPAARSELSDVEGLEDSFKRFERRMDAMLKELGAALRQAADEPLEPAAVRQIAQVGQGGEIEDLEQTAADVEGGVEQSQRTGDDGSITRGKQKTQNVNGPVKQELIAGKKISGSSQIVTGAGRRKPTQSAAPKPEHVAARIAFAPTADGARLRWEGATIGTRNSTFVSPFRGDDLELVLKVLEHLQHPTSFTTAEVADLTRLALPHHEGVIGQNSAPAIGSILFRALTADSEAAKTLDTLRTVATAAQLPLQLSLHFPREAVTLAALPWELLWERGEPAALLFSRGSTASLTRHIDLPQPAPAPRNDNAPLRILAIAPQANLSSEMHAAERIARHQAWQPLIDNGAVELLPDISPATPVALSDALRRQGPIDILHFIGHGQFREGKGYMVLDNPNGGIAPTPIDEIAPAISAAKVQLAVLTACQGGMVGAAPSSAGILGGIAPALIHAGVPLVIAMQFTVQQAAANRATGVIYERLAAGDSVQAAVAAARLDLRTTEKSSDRASWYVPTLYMRWAGETPARLRRG